MTRRTIRWQSTPPRATPKHPYRDTALVYGFFAVVVVLVAWATGGRLVRAIELAAVFFAAAVVWSWWNWHRRIARAAATAAFEEEDDVP